jgi:hypothetical protein
MNRLKVSKAVRHGRALMLAGALLGMAPSAALAQSTTAPPPTAPSASPTGNAMSAPSNPGSALPPAGQSSGGSAKPDSGTPPLKNDTSPPGMTKYGQ